MTSEAKQDTFITEDDLKTTVPNIRADEWKMPAPVFQRTSGRLAESFLKNAGMTKPDDGAPVMDPVTPTPPDEPRPKSPIMKLVVVGLALAAMIAFIAVFLTVVYFMFLR
jgi:hypothetical protein